MKRPHLLYYLWWLAWALLGSGTQQCGVFFHRGHMTHFLSYGILLYTLVPGTQSIFLFSSTSHTTQQHCDPGKVLTWAMHGHRIDSSVSFGWQSTEQQPRACSDFSALIHMCQSFKIAYGISLCIFISHLPQSCPRAATSDDLLTGARFCNLAMSAFTTRYFLPNLSNSMATVLS